MPKKTKLGNVTIVGLGQMGGSIAMRLTKQKAAVVTGYDIESAVIRKARRLKLAAAYTTDLARALEGADLVILAIPVGNIVAALRDEDIPFDPESVVLDVGSTKRMIIAAANRRRAPIHFVGGHPLAGVETNGLGGAEPDRFKDAPFVLVKSDSARVSDLALAKKLVKTLGARPMLMEPEEHDRITALTIGLPHLLAFMVRDIYEHAALADRRVQTLAGGSIWSTMRVSDSDPTMVFDFIESNSDFIAKWWQEMTTVKPTRKRKRRRNATP